MTNHWYRVFLTAVGVMALSACGANDRHAERGEAAVPPLSPVEPVESFDISTDSLPQVMVPTMNPATAVDGIEGICWAINEIALAASRHVLPLEGDGKIPKSTALMINGPAMADALSGVRERFATLDMTSIGRDSQGFAERLAKDLESLVNLLSQSESVPYERFAGGLQLDTYPSADIVAKQMEDVPSCQLYDGPIG